MRLTALRIALLRATTQGLRPLVVALFAKLVGFLWPAVREAMDVPALAGGAACALMIARSLIDQLLDPTDPDRLIVDDVSAAGLFHDFFRRLVAWCAFVVPVCLVWPRLGYRPEAGEALWFVFKIGVAWLVLSRLMQKQRVVRLVRADAGTGYRVLRNVLSTSYSALSAFVFALLILWGAGYTRLAGFLTRAAGFTALFAFLAAAGWSLFDKVLPATVSGPGSSGESEDDLSIDLDGAPRIAWTSVDLGRFAAKGVLSVLTVVGLYFAWGGSMVGLELVYLAYHATVNLGGLHLSVARIFEAALYVFLCLGLSNLARGFLDRSVWPNTPIDRGISHALNTVLHYMMIALAGLLIIEVFGIGSDSIKWFAGFIGIGVGFGMQTIVNNLASGIILLAERPIKPGDRVKVGEHEGEVTKISVRATTIRSQDNIETIVPNADFVGKEVVNWSYSDPNVRVHVPVGVAYGSDVRLVKDALQTVARNHRLVLKRPAPEVRFVSFGDSSLDFELLAWVSYPFLIPRIHSDLNFAIDAEFRRRRIEISFPQRDLHIRTGVLPVRMVMDPEQEDGPGADGTTPPPKPSLPG